MYAYPQDSLMQDLLWIPILGEYYHRGCMRAMVYDMRQMTGIDMSPVLRWFNITPTKEKQSG